MKAIILSACVCISSLLLSPMALAEDKKLDHQLELEHGPRGEVTFKPPSVRTMPEGEYGRMVKLGYDIFTNTQKHAEKFVGNGMNCSNCHLDDGRRGFSAPLWAATPVYPRYRKKNDIVNTLQTRMQGCFKYSMNGTPPPVDSEVMTALVTYSYWMAEGAPLGKILPGRGFYKLDKPAKKPDFTRGQMIYRESCVLCHGENGEGTKVNGKYHFPPLWGPDSYNWGAGMHRINTAAGFIKMNMPYGNDETLTDQQAWDVSLYINSHDRPEDPRIASVNSDFRKLDSILHDHQCSHGDKINGQVLGTGIRRTR